MNKTPVRQYLVEHVSDFRYTEAAHGSVMLLRLRPREDQGQRVRAFGLDTDPAALPTAVEDAFGNACHLLNIHRAHRRSVVCSRTRVEVAGAPERPERMAGDAWQALAEAADPVRYWEFLNPSRFAQPSPALDAFAASRAIERGPDPFATLMRTSSVLHSAFTYAPGSTEVDSPTEHILETGHGVCQDYTHVMIALARSWGIPTRYVSGYIHLEGAAGEVTPAGASHAWAECLLPDIGWVGIDPTNDTLADHRHIRVAIGRDYADAAPTRGTVFGGGETTLEVRVTVAEDDEETPSGATHRGPAPLLNVTPRPGALQAGFDQ